MTAGLSTAATFGIMTAMAAGATSGGASVADDAVVPLEPPGAEAFPEAGGAGTVVVIRRHLVQVPAGPATPAPAGTAASPAPATPTATGATATSPAPNGPSAPAPAVTAPAAKSRPRPAPVARTRAS